MFRHTTALTAANTVDVIAFDKTGTLTKGVLAVVDNSFLRLGSEWIVSQLAAASKHPVSVAVTEYMKIQSMVNGSPLQVEKITAVPGSGMFGIVAGYEVKGGSPQYTQISDHPEVQRHVGKGHTIFTVTFGGQLIASFGLTDLARPESAKLVEDLRAGGRSVALLSGDHHHAVLAFCQEVGFDQSEAQASCTPASKAAYIRALQKKGKRVCFVGDGINDSVALSTADVSISLAEGSEIARTSSGIVLRGLDLRKDLHAVLNIAKLFQWHSMIALGWCMIYFTVALLLASGAAVKFRVTPQWAGFSEIISVGPVLFLGASLCVIRRTAR